MPMPRLRYPAALLFGVAFVYLPQLALAATLSPGADCVTGQTAPKSEYSINVPSLPLGGYAANSLSTDFTNAAGSVGANTYWTASSTKYLVPTNQAQFVLASKYCSRDEEVETWIRAGRVYLRLTPDGRGVFFDINPNTTNGTLIVGIATSTTETQYYPGYSRYLYSNDNMVGTIPGYSKTATDAQRFIFGVEGFDMYAKFNGVEFMRIKDFHHMAPGRMAIKTPAGYGVRSTTVRNFSNKTFLSDLVAGIYDPRDFGFRSIQTTGSISAGSNTLTLAGPTSFTVGDFVIVEIGKEPGAGMRGTKGVGGTWPAKSYPDLTTMQADTSQIDGLYAWREDTGDVYKFATATSSWGSAYSWYTAGTPAWGLDRAAKNYYSAKAIPRALQARVTAVANNGATLTLDKSATVSVSGANVYLDVAPILNFLVGTDNWYKFGGVPGDLTALVPLNMRTVLPAGSYAVGGAIITGGQRSNNVLYGQGSSTTMLFSPKGVPSASIWLNGSNNMVRDLRLVGNTGLNGFGIAWPTTIIPWGYGPSGLEVSYTSPGVVTETVIPQGMGWPFGILMYGSNLIVQDVKVDNVWQDAVGASYCYGCWAHRVENTQTDPLQNYIQWQFLWSDAVGGGCVDCIVKSDWLIAGFSIVKGNGVQFIRPKGINATFEVNSSGNFLYQDPETVIQPMRQSPSFSSNGYIMNINTNMDNALPVEQRDKRNAAGGKIINPHFIVEGPINTNNNGLNAIAIGNWAPNVTVQGGYIEGPNWKSPSTINTPVGVISQGTSTIVDGLRVVGTVNPALFPKGNIMLFKDGVARNCIADLIILFDKTTKKENCMTNAEYLASKAPKITITIPSNSNVSGAITVAASTTGANLQGVQFWLDGANLGSEDTMAPYSAGWNTASSTNGIHTLTAIARNALGQQASSTVSVHVANASPVAGVVCGSTTIAPVAEYGVPVSLLPLGSYATSSLSAYFENPAGIIFASKYWESIFTKYMRGNDYRYLIARSKYCSQDMEVDTWSRNGIVYLRLTDTGDALYFYHNGEVGSGGSLEVGVVKGYIDGIGFRWAQNGTYTVLYRNSNLASTTPTGYVKKLTDGHHFTFGVQGSDVYVRFNGIEFARFKTTHVAAGRAAIQANSGYGFRDLTIRHTGSAPIASAMPSGGVSASLIASSAPAWNALQEIQKIEDMLRMMLDLVDTIGKR
ncbi:Ig-like domain-containing protein [Candidatus Kaiserbacteria bacterium]|nr:Ig-like domain-containing protein [Candidatus Kaiserbacteria bacterium]